MIAQFLIPAIKQRFPEKHFAFNEAKNPIASLPNPCESLGGIDICDDGDEATVYLLNATHGHFSCDDEKLNEAAKEERISSDVIEFLSKLFEDRVVVWRVLGGMAGGWRVLDSHEPIPKPSKVRQQFLWSGEIE